MNVPKPCIVDFELRNELVFVTSRSSGPGGQSVNKVNTKVTLKWDVLGSSALTTEQKEVITNKLAARMTRSGFLLITAQDKRSQLENKDEVLRKLDQLLVQSFAPKKVRKATKPGKAARQKRINEKKIKSEKEAVATEALGVIF